MICKNILANQSFIKKVGGGTINLNPNPKSEDFKKVKTKLIIIFTYRCIVLTFFLITILILKYFFYIHIYNELYILILSWFILSYLSQYILKKGIIRLTTLKKLDFIHYTIGLLFMTGFFYYTGGILWIGAIFFVFPILYVSLLSTPKEGLIITLLAIVFFSLIVFLEYLGYLPHKEIIKSNFLL